MPQVKNLNSKEVIRIHLKKLLALVFTLACCSRFAFGGETDLMNRVIKAQRERAQQAQREGKVSLFYYLMKTSERLDFYYTLESKYDETLSWYYQFLLVPTDFEAKSIDEVISKINREVPEVTALRGKDNTAVTHIVAKRLRQLQDYPLDAPVSLSFADQLGILPSALDQKIKGDRRLQVDYGVGIGDNFFDYRTRVTFFQKKDVAREILTDYIPLQYYSRLMWEAQTFERQGRLRAPYRK
jgi:hypothetical protein